MAVPHIEPPNARAFNPRHMGAPRVTDPGARERGFLIAIGREVQAHSFRHKLDRAKLRKDLGLTSEDFQRFEGSRVSEPVVSDPAQIVRAVGKQHALLKLSDIALIHFKGADAPASSMDWWRPLLEAQREVAKDQAAFRKNSRAVGGSRSADPFGL